MLPHFRKAQRNDKKKALLLILDYCERFSILKEGKLTELKCDFVNEYIESGAVEKLASLKHLLKDQPKEWLWETFYFALAVEAPKYEIIQYFLNLLPEEEIPPLFECGGQDSMLLFSAAQANTLSVELIDLYQKHGGTVNIKIDGHTVLDYFCETFELKYKSVIAKLLSFGEQIVDPVVLLMNFAKRGDVEIMQMLLSKLSDEYKERVLNAVCTATSSEVRTTTPFIEAVKAGKEENARFLLREGARLEPQEPFPYEDSFYTALGVLFDPKTPKIDTKALIIEMLHAGITPSSEIVGNLVKRELFNDSESTDLLESMLTHVAPECWPDIKFDDVGEPYLTQIVSFSTLDGEKVIGEFVTIIAINEEGKKEVRVELNTPRLEDKEKVTSGVFMEAFEDAEVFLEKAGVSADGILEYVLVVPVAPENIQEEGTKKGKRFSLANPFRRKTRKSVVKTMEPMNTPEPTNTLEKMALKKLLRGEASVGISELGSVFEHVELEGGGTAAASPGAQFLSGGGSLVRRRFSSTSIGGGRQSSRSSVSATSQKSIEQVSVPESSTVITEGGGAPVRKRKSSVGSLI